jgi:pilus assembly protein CpaE
MFARANPEPVKTRVVAQCRDADFERLVRSTFGMDGKVELILTVGAFASEARKLDTADATVVIVDIDPGSEADFTALNALTQRLGGMPPVIVAIPVFDVSLARQLLQMRVADFVVKPVQPLDLVRACARAAQGAQNGGGATEATIYTFLPAAGGVGLTTLAIQTAMLLLKGEGGKKTNTCLVDLDFQHGSCCDYLDLEPRLDLDEIEPRPDRLDRQLLEVMISEHPSGLKVIAAPSRPAEMRSFDFEVVTRLLDLVASHFDNVVIDVPRTWFAWTDSVLIGSNRLFLVTEMTVPGLRHARHLVNVIRERLADGPRPEVIVNRFEQRLFGPGLRRADIEQALGDTLALTIPNNFRLTSEAIDRGVPLDEVKAGNNISGALAKLIVPPRKPKGAATPALALSERKLALVR